MAMTTETKEYYILKAKAISSYAIESAPKYNLGDFVSNMYKQRNGLPVRNLKTSAQGIIRRLIKNRLAHGGIQDKLRVGAYK